MFYVRIPFDFRERGDYTHVIARRDNPINAIGIVEQLNDDLEEITDGEYNSERTSIETYNAGLSPVEPDPVPNPKGLLLALFGGLGKSKARSVARDYPDFTLALQADPPNYTVARAAVEDAHDEDDLNLTEYNLIQTLFGMYNIPEA